MAMAMGLQVGLQPEKAVVGGLVTGRSGGDATHSSPSLHFSAASSVFLGRLQAAAVLPVSAKARASSVNVCCGAATAVDGTTVSAGTHLPITFSGFSRISIHSWV